jgi:hypothetical protein
MFTKALIQTGLAETGNAFLEKQEILTFPWCLSSVCVKDVKETAFSMSHLPENGVFSYFSLAKAISLPCLPLEIRFCQPLLLVLSSVFFSGCPNQEV